MLKPSHEFSIQGQKIGFAHPTYFIADIAANHDGDLGHAKELIYLAKEAGADAAKFQHFKAETIVSDYAFRNLGGHQSHQSTWKKSVFEVYKNASIDDAWTPVLKETCDKAGIHFFTSPYGYDRVEAVDPYVCAYKIGSGDVTWPDYITYVASKGKPTILAVGAATDEDVRRAVEAMLEVNPNVALLQCNTNYTASLDNFKYINLNVLQTFQKEYPGLILGLSDHTPGHATVLGAIALGGRIIEKHFTDDVTREGPDHKFSMDPRTWREMVDRSRELELALGDGVKRVEANEAIIVQRRGLCASADLAADTTLTRDNLTTLRPCPEDGVPPYKLEDVVGKRLKRAFKKGESLRWQDIA